MVRATDVMGFAGGFTLGVVQSGFELVAKKEMKGGFGLGNCEANRHLLGNGWQAQVGDPLEWEPTPGVELVFGNPPCSGFSVMTDKKHRGMDARINECMWAFANYVAGTRPPIAMFESVRSAFGKGRPLMVALRDYVEQRTGLRYDLWHVMHNARELGGAGERPRYFWVVSQVPFGVDYPLVPRRPLLWEVIDDLQGLADTWLPQPYRRPPTWWSEPARSTSGLVDGHKRNHGSLHQRAYDLMNANGGWPAGWWQSKVLQEYYEAHGTVPESWEPYIDKIIANKFHMGYIQLTRWNPENAARVITGGALDLVMHPYEPRTITHREAARIMGFPDDWRILPLMRKPGLRLTWGKGISVQCGRWAGYQVQNALAGHPGSVTGELIGDRERLIVPPGQRVAVPKISLHTQPGYGMIEPVAS